MSNCTVIEHEVPIVIISDDCDAEPIVRAALEAALAEKGDDRG